MSAGDRAVAEVLAPLSCEACGARGVPLDLDVRQTPTEIVCRRCKRKPKCPGCKKRRHSLVLQPTGSNPMLLCSRCS